MYPAAVKIRTTMREPSEELQPQQKLPRTKKRTYRSPTLTEFGTIESITQGGGGHADDFGAFTAFV